MGLRSTDECPRCKEPETTTHVWLCQAEETTELWNTRIEELQQHMEDVHTDPEISAQIIEGLNSWRLGNPTSTSSQSSAHSAASLQEDIGWQHFFEGRQATRWRELQHEYLQNTQSRRSSKRWSTAIIKKLWDIAWDLWEKRNGRLHHIEEGFVLAETGKRIQDLWMDQRLRQIPSVQKLLPGRVEVLLEKSAHHRQQWLVQMEAALSRNRTTPTF
jgi:hypothetical protein